MPVCVLFVARLASLVSPSPSHCCSPPPPPPLGLVFYLAHLPHPFTSLSLRLFFFFFIFFCSPAPSATLLLNTQQSHALGVRRPADCGLFFLHCSPGAGQSGRRLAATAPVSSAAGFQNTGRSVRPIEAKGGGVAVGGQSGGGRGERGRKII